MSILDDTRMMIKVCKMYYQEGLSQNEIAKKMKISRPTVSRHLNQAKRKGIVEIKINENDLLELEKELEEKYKIKEVICVQKNHNLKSTLGKSAADYILRNLKDGDTLAVSAGTTVDQVAKMLATHKTFPNSLLIPLVGGMGNVTIDIHANHIVDTFSKKLGAKSLFLHAPVVVDDKYSKEFIMKQKFVQNITENFSKTKIAVVGIGSNPLESTMVSAYNDELSISDVSKINATGDIFYNFIDEEGKQLDCEWNDKVISISFEEYKKIPLKIGVAGGINKASAIHAALKNELIDVLVIDEETAINILEKY